MINLERDIRSTSSLRPVAFWLSLSNSELLSLVKLLVLVLVALVRKPALLLKLRLPCFLPPRRLVISLLRFPLPRLIPLTCLRLLTPPSARLPLPRPIILLLHLLFLPLQHLLL